MLRQRGIRTICYTLCCLLVVSAWALSLTFATETKDKLNQVNQDKAATEAELAKGKREAAALNKEITRLEKEINESEKEMKTLQGDIGKTKQTIAKVEENLKQIQEEMVEQNDNMNDRIVAMYKNGDAGIVEVLLGSTDISDFMTNLDMVQRIYDSDMELLKAMKAQYEKIELQKEQLVALQEELNRQKQSEAVQQEKLEISRGMVADKKADVLKNNAALEAQIDAFNREAARLEAEIRGLQGDSVYAGGALGWPVPGISRITSEFGYRIHPILKVNKLHTGMDIGAPSGSTVVAAASGTVIKAGWNNSYGNVVMIDHGSEIVTLYAHNSSLLVKQGDYVTKGQSIAKSGSTGMSTGPHVHFEVRVNGAYKNPRDYL